MIKDWIFAFRPKTLTAAIVPILVGTTLTAALGYSIQWKISLWALLSSLFIQIGTNLINDAMDFKKGADTHDRVGPARITQSGKASFKQVIFWGLLFFILALIFGIPLVLKGGLPILMIGLISLICGYAYTGGPYPLAYHGLGDFFVIIFFGIIAVSGILYLQIDEWPLEGLVAGTQIGFLATVLIAINNFRDIEGDRKVNKKTLPVRFGDSFARVEIITLILSCYVLNIYWWNEGFKFSAFLSFLSLPLGLIIIKNILNHNPSPVYNRFLAQSALLHLIFGVLLSLGFII